MKKGVVFTMDAAFALYISLLVMGTMMVLLEADTNYSDDPLALSRLAKDLYEVRKYDLTLNLPSFIKKGSACDGKTLIAAVQNVTYRDIQYDDYSWTTKSSVSITTDKVCYG